MNITWNGCYWNKYVIENSFQNILFTVMSYNFVYISNLYFPSKLQPLQNNIIFSPFRYNLSFSRRRNFLYQTPLLFIVPEFPVLDLNFSLKMAFQKIKVANPIVEMDGQILIYVSLYAFVWLCDFFFSTFLKLMFVNRCGCYIQVYVVILVKELIFMLILDYGWKGSLLNHCKRVSVGFYFISFAFLSTSPLISGGCSFIKICVFSL